MEMLQRQEGEIVRDRVFQVVKEETGASPLILKAVMMRLGWLYLEASHHIGSHVVGWSGSSLEERSSNLNQWNRALKLCR